MKIFPPQNRFLFCLNLFKQTKKASEKIFFSFHRFLNVEKTALKFIQFKNSIDFVSDEETTYDTGTKYHLRSYHSMLNIKCIENIHNTKKPTLQLYKSFISTYLF